MKEGEPGAANGPQIAWVEIYDGNGTAAAGKPWPAVVQSVMGPRCKNIADDQTQKGGPDHDTRRGMALDPDTGLFIQGTSSKGKIPHQTTVHMWFGGRCDQLRAARDCNEGVMH